jgi:hypothetical protein
MDLKGRIIAQAVSHWLPTAVARVRSRVLSNWICGGQSGAGAGFLRVLRFPPPIFIPPIAPQSPSPIIWGWYNRPEVAAVQGTSNTRLCWSMAFASNRGVRKGMFKKTDRQKGKYEFLKDD